MKDWLLKRIMLYIYNNEDLYNRFLVDLTHMNKARFIKESLNYKGILIREYIKSEDMDKIENCIIINSTFRNCNIKEIKNNICDVVVFDNNRIN